MIDAPSSSDMPSHLGPPEPTPPSPSSSSSERRSPASKKRAYYLIGAAALALFVGLLIGLLATRQGGSNGHHASPEAAAATTDTLQVTTTTSTLATSGRDGPPPDAAASLPPLATDTSTNTTTKATPAATTTTATTNNKGKGPLGSLLNAQQQQAQQLGSTVGALSASLNALNAAKQATSTFLAVAGCTPSTGEELTYMVEQTDCSTVTLKPNTNYSLPMNIIVRRRVTIIGRPLGMPTIDAHNTSRAFLVESGGFLDVRFVLVIKGGPIEVIPFVEYHIRAPIAYVRTGGVVIFTGCRFTISFTEAFAVIGLTPPFTNIRVFGGGIVSETSTVRVQDCLFYSFRPGVAFREIQFIGGEVLVLGGSTFLTGNIFENTAIFTNSLGVGGYVANLGGNIVITGCIFSYGGAFVATHGLGFLYFLGGGVTSVTGTIITTDIGAAAFFGGGIGIFTGSGISSMCGFIYSDDIAIAIAAGLGFQSAIGAGVSIRTGIVQSSMGALSFGVGVGLNTYVGAGVGVFTDITNTIDNAASSFYGVGSSVYVGAGVLTTTNTLTFGNNGVTSIACIGADTAVLAGWWTRTNALTITASAVAFFVGQGANVFVGLGGHAMIMVGFIGAPTPVAYANPGLVAVYVAGNNVILGEQVGQAFVYKLVTTTKKGQTDWCRNIFIARKTSWRFSGAGPRAEDFAEDFRHQRRSLLQEQQRKPALPSLARVVREKAKKKQEERDLLEEVQKEVFEKGQETAAAAASAAAAAAAAAAGAGGESVARALYTNKPHPKTPHFHTTRNLGVKTSFDVKPVIQQMLDEYIGDGGGGGGAIGAVKDAVQGVATAKAALIVNETATETTPVGIGGDGAAPLNTSAFADHPWYYFANLPGLKVEKSKTNKIYVASKLDSCSVCGVTPGDTLDNIDGPGAEACEVANACEHVDGAEAMGKASAVLAAPSSSSSSSSTEAEDLQAALGDDVIKQMWVVGRNESTPDSIISTVDLRATFTPTLDNGVYTTVNKEQVLAAVTEAISTLGVSNRWHLRVEDSTDAPKNFDSLLTLSAANTQGTEDAAMGAGHDYGSMDLGEVAGQQECGRNELFKAYVVSDWKNVTDAVNHALKTSGGQKALTAALQAQVSNTTTSTSTAATICSLSAYRTTSLFIPANTVAGISHAPESSSHSIVPVSRRTTMVTRRRRRLAGEEGGPEGEEIEVEEEEEEDDDQTKAVLGQAPQIALTLPPPKQSSPWAMLRELPPRVDEVLRSDDYAIVLTSFPPGQLLTLHLVPDKGEEVLVATFISLPHPLTKQQVYRWSPGSSKAVQALEDGEYYLEVTSQKGDAFAYSQAFELN